MEKTIFMALLAAFSLQLHAQDSQQNTEQVWRINILNPGVEYEFPTGDNSTFSANIGVGFGGSYPKLDSSQKIDAIISADYNSNITYLISPFLDIQEKWFYNFSKRLNKEKSIDKNSGNFISVRLLMRGPTLIGSFSRTSQFDFAFGPTWGIQRNYGRFHLLFDIGPVFYFDTKQNSDIFPLMFQLNLGFDL